MAKRGWLLRRLGCWATDDGRIFRNCNEDGSKKLGFYSLEVGTDKPFGGYGFGCWFEFGRTQKRKLYVSLWNVRVYLTWVVRTPSARPCERFGAEFQWDFAQLWWGHVENSYGDKGRGVHRFIRWRDRLWDALFGKTIYIKERRDDRWQVEKGVVTMPEGDYPATFTKEIAVWMRPRWPFRKVIYSTDVDIPCGIPCSGKGENSYDCDEDGLYGCGISAKTREDGWNTQRAAAHAASAALRDRAKRGDQQCWPVPAAARVAAYAKRQEEAKS